MEKIDEWKEEGKEEESYIWKKSGGVGVKEEHENDPWKGRVK